MRRFGEKNIKNIKINKDQIINQALRFHYEGNIAEAIKYYKYCINHNLKDHRVFSNYGLIMQNLGRLKEAELLQRKAITLKPDFEAGHSNLGTILKMTGKLKEAEQCQRKAIALKPNFALAHSNLGNILYDLGKLREAEISFRKAIELNPKDKNIEKNLIRLLTVHNPKKINSNQLFKINQEFKELNTEINEQKIISDKKIIELYDNGLKIYKKYNLDLETPFTQIFQRNEKNLDCQRHKQIFNSQKIIPKFCFECYKVQIEVFSIIDLLKLYLVFNSLKIPKNNTRKCMIEVRRNVDGFYKGLIYCSSLKEAFIISEQINIRVQQNIRSNLVSKVKRGCTEYGVAYPKYKEIRKTGDQPMKYNEGWQKIEEKFDKDERNWGISNQTIKGFNLNNFLIIRNWITYAQKIGDISVNEITNEKIEGPKSFNYLNKILN